MITFMITAAGMPNTGDGAVARIASGITTAPGMIMAVTTGAIVTVDMIVGTAADMAEAADTTEIETNKSNDTRP